MNIKINPTETGYVEVDWIHLAQDRDQCWELVNTAINLLAVTKSTISSQYSNGLFIFIGSQYVIPLFRKQVLVPNFSLLGCYDAWTCR
jgi:hypothetical protein